MSNKEGVTLSKAKEDAEEKWREALYFYCLMRHLEMTNKSIFDGFALTPVIAGSNNIFKNIADEYSYLLSAFSNACYSAVKYLEQTKIAEINKEAIYFRTQKYVHVYGCGRKDKGWRNRSTHLYPVKPDVKYDMPGPAGIIAAAMGIHDKEAFSKSVLFCSDEKDENGVDVKCLISAECEDHLEQLLKFIKKW